MELLLNKKQAYYKVIRRIVKSIYCIGLPLILIIFTYILHHLDKLNDPINITIVVVGTIAALFASITMALTIKERIIPAIKIDTFPGLLIGAGYDDSGKEGGVIIIIAFIIVKLYYPRELSGGLIL